MFHKAVTVDQDVAKRDDPLMVTDLGGSGAVGFIQTADCFADDLEASLYRKPEDFVGLVVGELLPGCDIQYGLPGLPSILEELRRARLHTRAGGSRSGT